MSILSRIRAASAKLAPLRRFVGRPFQSFLGSLLLIILVPLLPLLFEYLARDAIKDETWAITAAMYASGIGFTTRIPVLCYTGIFVAFFMSFVFGLDVSGKPPQHVGWTPTVAIAIFAFGHAAERYKLHAIDGRPIFEFT